MMSDGTNLESNINCIYDNLDLLESGHVYELKKTPGTPKCATLAGRIRDDVDMIVKELEEKENMEETDEEQFDLLAKLLGALYAEFSTLSKKQPDALTNVFKKSGQSCTFSIETDDGSRRFYSVSGFVIGGR